MSVAAIEVSREVVKLDEDDRCDHERHHDNQDEHGDQAELTSANLIDRLNDRSREVDDDSREDDE